MEAKFERIFIALDVPPPTSGELLAIQEPRAEFCWRSEEKMHLTLRFVGEVDEALRQAISQMLTNIAVEPFILPVEKMGVFPVHGRPQVIYAGVGSAHPRLYQLQYRIEEGLANLGLPLELRAFTPHITLARVSNANTASVREFLKQHREFAAAPFKVESFHLYRTHMTHFGAQYEKLAEFPLKAAKLKAG